MTVLFPYLHYLGIMVLMGSLITEHITLKPNLSKAQIKSLAVTDLIYLFSAVLVLTTGILRWFLYGKGYDYYMSNPLFHIKLTVFIIIGVLSIFPTLRILKWRKMVKHNKTPEISGKETKRLLMFIRIELLLLAVIPLLAVMVTRGSGVN